MKGAIKQWLKGLWRSNLGAALCNVLLAYVVMMLKALIQQYMSRMNENRLLPTR